MKKFNHLFILGRPAGGKSEFIDFMKKVPEAERIEKYHIGKFEEVDDFKWLFNLFIEDDDREKRGEKRLHSEKKSDGYNLLNPKFRGTLVGKFNDTITERYLNHPDFYKNGTVFIEFARGKCDGFKHSLDQFKKEILKDAAILFINVSFEESCRKNNSRFKKGEEGSILFHKVPDKDMNEFFIENDWAAITDNKPNGYLQLNGTKVPFITMNNEPESKDPNVLDKRYGQALQELMELYQKK